MRAGRHVSLPLFLLVFYALAHEPTVISEKKNKVTAAGSAAIGYFESHAGCGVTLGCGEKRSDWTAQLAGGQTQWRDDEKLPEVKTWIRPQSQL